MSDTLVLDMTWTPVARISWMRAISLIFLGKCEIVEEYENRFVHSVTLEFKMPSVIRFLRSVRNKKKAIRFSRENVYIRDRGCCQYCGNKVHRHESTYDHVTPRSQDGKTDWTNVVICCVSCNQRKGGRTPEQAKMKLLSVPLKPKHLPDALRFTFTYDKSMPASWGKFLRDYQYWNVELEHD